MKFGGSFGLGTVMSQLLVALIWVMPSGLLRAERYSSDTTIGGDTPSVIASGETLEFDIDAGVVVTVTRVISGEGTLVKKGQIKSFVGFCQMIIDFWDRAGNIEKDFDVF